MARGGIDLILLDLSLPDAHGLSTVERTLAAAPRVPILVLTGLEDEVVGAAAVHAGAQDYLVKGQVDGAALVRAMRYAGERHRLLETRTEDARVWSAIARSGAALLAAGSGAAMLDTLGLVAVDALGCATTSTWMLDPSGEAFGAVAARPLTESQRLAGVVLSREMLRPFLRADDDAARWLTPRLRRALPAPLLPPEPYRDALYLVFVRGGALEGVQVCAFPERVDDADVVMRIAQGLVHVAGLALRNARLIDELERSNTVKTYFAATMSHEIGNTLFAIRGVGEMLEHRLEQTGATEEYRLAHAVTERARQSMGIIQAALELTRSEVRAALEPAPFSVPELLDQLASDTHVPADKPELRVEWSVPESLPLMKSDPVKLVMVLRNLIGNAIKFSERGRVQVAVDQEGDALRFVVADTGIGIDASELPDLFQPFRQAHGARSRRAGGAGLGLYIVGRLVELLDGRITVDSRPGMGTTFTMTVPCGTAAAVQAAGGDG